MTNSSTPPATNTGLHIERRHTTPNDPFPGVEWVKRSAAITNPDGSVVFSMPSVEVPSTWDQVSVDVVASKYLRKEGVPQYNDDGTQILDDDLAPVLGPETSVKQAALRIANAWRIWGDRGGYFATPTDSLAFRDEIAYMIVTQMGSPNSPQWFNTGLNEAYGIEGDPEGNVYYDPETDEVVESPHKHFRSAANACFIQSVDDQLVGDGSIFDLMEREARLFKGGSGSGTNFSNIRGKNEKLSAGGVSSGLMSFLKVSDAAAGGIKSGGTTRRAAKMVLVDVDHPEIIDFIWAKAKEERKAAALVAAGWDPSWNAEDGAYANSHYQNFNGSVMITPGFMDAVQRGADWDLVARTNRAVTSTLPARSLWDQIAEAAWQCADPGVMFSDIINDWNTAANDEPIVGTNPCAEYVYINDTACNLASLNLLRFYDDASRTFNEDEFRHAARLWTIALEITVAMSHYPSPDIARRSWEHRTLGLGYANLGALLMRAGLPYDSEQGRAAMAAITSVMLTTAYATSAEMAAAVGPSVAYGRNVEPAQRVIRNHARAAWGSDRHDSPWGPYENLTVNYPGIDHQVLAEGPFANLSAVAKDCAVKMVEAVETDGLRNQQVVVIAPTGTIGLQMGCDTTGVEPSFALVVGKKLAGGGYMKIVNSSVEPALVGLGYSPDEVAAIIGHALGTGTLQGATAVNRGALAAKGLPEDALDRIEARLASAFVLNDAVSPSVVGDDALVAAGIDLDQAHQPGFDLLSVFGFSPREIHQSSQTICGHQTVEGAPGLKDEHLAVFDCANYCGDGSRAIHWSGHVKALGAVAPHVSGSVSKTINMPNDVTVADVKEAYELTYAYGVKNCAIYRDGSKGSQVLASGRLDNDTVADQPELTDDDIEAMMEEAVAEAARMLTTIEPGTSPTEFYKGRTPPKFRLPSLSFGPRWKFTVGDTEVFLRAGEYEDGTLGEIFVDLSKEGSTLKGVLSCFAIAISQGLGHGVPLEKFVDTFCFHTFEPRGLVQGHDQLKMANSIVDAMFRVLGHHYLGRDDLVQVKTRPKRTTSAIQADTAAAVASGGSADSAGDFTATVDEDVPSTPRNEPGPACSSCGNATVRSGACYRCLSCGESSGCS